MQEITYTETENNDITEPKKEVKKVNMIGCNNCHKTNVTLIKATDSYYCRPCFLTLGKKKYDKKKGGRRK